MCYIGKCNTGVLYAKVLKYVTLKDNKCTKSFLSIQNDDQALFWYESSQFLLTNWKQNLV